MSLLSLPNPIETIQYDFENYALEKGIPETRDPLPYRKTGSVFGGEPNESNNNAGDHDSTAVLTSAKHDPRLRTVVCRHWLRDLCMKGAACEFLHQYDLAKMPVCRHGERCKIKDCPFRHIKEENRMDCAFYKNGFCVHGPFCRYKHTQRRREDLPVVADFTVGLSQVQPAGKEAEQQQRRPAAKPNEFYKISLCKHFMAGECPFGDSCHFAHGHDELRQYPGKNQPAEEAEELADEMFSNHDQTTMEYYEGGASGGGKPCPIVEPDQAAFYILMAARHRDLAISTTRGVWYLQERHAHEINKAYSEGKKQVMIFFTVYDSRHIQGAVLVSSKAELDEDADHAGTSFCYKVGVEWYRTTELKEKVALKAAPDLKMPVDRESSMQTMDSKVGESLMKAMWNSPLVTLYEAWASDEEPPATEALLTDFRAPAEDEVAWPTKPTPGFIFGCTSDTMDECLGRGLFGLPDKMKAAASAIVPGSSIFLFNVTDKLLFGVFEALTPAAMNIDPRAFSRNPNATSSPFPVQVRIRISLECPPLEDTDIILNDILRFRGSGRIGPLTYAQTEAIATMLASQCGALQYMSEYADAVKEGENVRDPPIALPPRKIPMKDTTMKGDDK